MKALSPSACVRKNQQGKPQRSLCWTAVPVERPSTRVTFYGNWSEKVHTKDYPRRANHWSSIIGASHSRDYVLWEYGGYASEGVRQVAELGSPVKMEEEIRQKPSQDASPTWSRRRREPPGGRQRLDDRQRGSVPGI
ncbi:spondin-1-like [Osmerus eperlanus]|uniref:spondin-1-like n=1 Tax=Osmerus eperlanus TaxID=29151 RepID=UPI002E0D22E9